MSVNPFPVPRRLLLAALAAAVAACGQQKEAPKVAPAPPRIGVAAVRTAAVPVIREYVGTVAAYRSVEITARVEGFLEARHFTEGTDVRKGDLLYTIDPAQYQAKVRDAEAELARAAANLGNARAKAERLAPLAKEEAISQQDFDDAVAAQKAAEAQVESARANLETAKLNLGYTSVYATESGRIGQLITEEAPSIEGLEVLAGGQYLASIDPPQTELIGIAFAVVVLIVAYLRVTQFDTSIWFAGIAALLAGVALGKVGVEELGAKVTGVAKAKKGATVTFEPVKGGDAETVEADSAAKYDALQARMRPHFLFNSLNTIAHLVHIDANKAEDALLDLADIMRLTLDKRSRISLKEELNLTLAYLRMEGLRLGEKRLHVKLDMDQNSLPLEMDIPPF